MNSSIRVFENQFKAEQSLSCKWSVKLAQKSYVYKIFIKGAAFGECNQEVPKLSGKIWNLGTLYFPNFEFSIYLKLKMTESMFLEHAAMNQTLWEHFLELKSPLTLKVNLVFFLIR